MALRNALAHFDEDAEEVRYIGPDIEQLLDYARKAYGFEDRFELQGQYYEINTDT